MNETVSRLLDAYRAEFTEKLREWVRIPSVQGEAEDGAPFGKEVRHMLDAAEADAKAMGFPVRDFDGYACDITLGDRPEMIAVLGHLDVVPAGDGWNYPPFGAEMDGTRIYGRGTSDDKGPALASLYAMRAIREAGIPLKKSIRLILGCNEETDWKDMEWYSAHAEIPAVGFSPDASFPVINTEKAIIHLRFTAPETGSGLQVVEMSTGERPNVIPGECTAVVRGGEELAGKVRTWGLEKNLPVNAEVVPEGVRITAEGIPGHSAYPEGRRNAIGMMICLLRDLGAEGPLKVLADAVGMTHDGSGLGCACSDEVSGPLTCNMGILHLKDGAWTGTLDMRCPVNADLPALRDAAKAHLPGFEVETLEMKPAHHVPADSELVTQLLAAYEEETGLPGETIATGGGTYAKVLSQGVAFGATFPDDEDLAHQANEYADMDRLVTAAKIYANALIRLAGD
ncbi:M20 family metallopeptidase [Clostridiales bacterium]|nr:M20 family metallopeptidase [Clostridiales bacterium]